MRLKIKKECKHFRGDIPCKFHKTHKVKDCEECEFYKPLEDKILIIKIGALGDVIRTTSLLPALRKKYPKAHINWLIKENSVDILEDHPLLDEILIYDADTLARLHIEKYDLVICLDKDLPSTSIASLVKADKKLGFGSDENGKTIFFNEEAKYLYENGLNDDLNKENQKSYQEMMFETSQLEYDKEEYSISLKNVDSRFASDFLRKYEIKATDRIIGINVGASPRWPLKRWHLEKFIELIDKLNYELNAKVILLGGPFEIDKSYEAFRRHQIESVYKMVDGIKTDLIDATKHHNLPEFAYLVNQCDVLVTGDTAPMHIAMAMKVPVVVLFGPTSDREIELYGRGIKIVPNMDCLGCYNTKCDIKPNCMDLIGVDEVFNGVKSLIK